MSYAAAAHKVQQEEKSATAVQIDGLVALKIAQHCKDNMPSLVTGQLLGLDVGTTLEITHCFPFPVRAAPRARPQRAPSAAEPPGCGLRRRNACVCPPFWRPRPNRRGGGADTRALRVRLSPPSHRGAARRGGAGACRCRTRPAARCAPREVRDRRGG